MAALTLTEKSVMSRVEAFQFKMKFAMTKEAGYWSLITPSVIGDYNRQLQKRKRFAKKILDGNTQINPQLLCEYILMLYTNANPDLESGILSDAAVQSLMTTVFDYFGMVTGDDANDSIEW